MTGPAAGPARTVDPIRVACCQVALRVGDLAGNRAACERAVTGAAARGARIVVLPELASSGYVFRDRAETRSLAEPADGPTAAQWASMAARLGITLAGGICERGTDGLLYNTAIVVDGSGLRARYRKAHLWDAEKLIFTPGPDPPPVIRAGGALITVMICYDLEFPEWVRLAAMAGAQLACVPANWPRTPRPPGERPMEVIRAQAAASVNRMFVAVCDRAGPERDVAWVGGSVIIDADGWPLDGPHPGDGQAVLAADCRLEDATDKSISARNDVLADRRPALYGPVAVPAPPEMARPGKAAPGRTALSPPGGDGGWPHGGQQATTRRDRQR